MSLAGAGDDLGDSRCEHRLRPAVRSSPERNASRFRRAYRCRRRTGRRSRCRPRPAEGDRKKTDLPRPARRRPGTAADGPPAGCLRPPGLVAGRSGDRVHGRSGRAARPHAPVPRGPDDVPRRRPRPARRRRHRPLRGRRRRRHGTAADRRPVDERRATVVARPAAPVRPRLVPAGPPVDPAGAAARALGGERGTEEPLRRQRPGDRYSATRKLGLWTVADTGGDPECRTASVRAGVGTSPMTER